PRTSSAPSRPISSRAAPQISSFRQHLLAAAAPLVHLLATFLSHVPATLRFRHPTPADPSQYPIVVGILSGIHKSTATSLTGRAQQTSTLPSAGLSRGSGS